MSDTFDINDRSTWAWIDDGEVSASWADDAGYTVNPDDPSSFYQISNGKPYKHPCPEGLVFNPRANPGPVCDWPPNCSEADIYDWAVSKGLVNDQR